MDRIGPALSLMSKILKHICGAMYGNMKVIVETDWQKGGKPGFYSSSIIVYLTVYVLTEPLRPSVYKKCCGSKR